MKSLLLILLFAGCSHGPLKGSGEVAPTPAGHAKLCADKTIDMPGCPK